MGFYPINEVTVKRKDYKFTVDVHDDVCRAHTEYAKKIYVPDIYTFDTLREALEFANQKLLELEM